MLFFLRPVRQKTLRFLHQNGCKPVCGTVVAAILGCESYAAKGNVSNGVSAEGLRENLHVWSKSQEGIGKIPPNAFKNPQSVRGLDPGEKVSRQSFALSRTCSSLAQLTVHLSMRGVCSLGQLGFGHPLITTLRIITCWMNQAGVHTLTPDPDAFHSIAIHLPFVS